MFMLAGYESTSYALVYCFYVLAMHKEEQDKIVAEIDSHFGKESDVFFIFFFIKFTIYLKKINSKVDT